jgi:hypothetical protein
LIDKVIFDIAAVKSPKEKKILSSPGSKSSITFPQKKKKKKFRFGFYST